MQFIPGIVEKFTRVPKTIQEWNEKLLFGILASLLFFGAPALISSVKMAIDTGQPINLVIYVFCYGFAAFLLFTPTVPYKVKAIFTVLLIFFLGLVALRTLGPIGSWRIYLFASAILAALLLGTRAGFVTLAGIYCLAFVFSILLHNGTIHWNLNELYDFNAWKVTTITFLFLTSVCTIAISLLISGIRRFHAAAEQSARDLESASNRLREEIAEHQKTLNDLRISRDQLFLARS
ncbi:hypothetical protein [Desulfatibacillum aliphaticivorans]|uniref:hypothetical protein n=1 Tax=Desulfatibacillum aliphaticivorans TaxID=218208 RepID=UPI00040F772A|nr:hypothetical protein [Desulfatibacillum aliphaticivorans]